MYCPKCGKAYTDDTVFCVECGTKIRHSILTQQTQPQSSSAVPVYQAYPYAATASRGAGKGLIIGLIAGAAAVIAAVVLILLFALSPSAVPADKTMNALFPEMKLLKEAAKSGCIVTVGGKLGNDSGALDGMSFEATAKKTGNKASVEAEVKTDENKVDGAFAFDGESFAVSSEYLLDGKSYCLNLTGLSEALEKSVFAPDSGSEYAISQEQFDKLVDIAEAYEANAETLSGDTYALLGESLNSIISDTVSRLKGSTESKSITLRGEKINAELTSYDIDKKMITAFAEAVGAEWKSNEKLRDMVKAMLDSYYGYQSSLYSYYGIDYDNYTGQTIKALDELLIDDLDDTLSAVFENISIDGELELYVYNGYLVALNLSLTVGDKTYSSPAVSIDFSVEFSADPASDSRADAELVIKDAGGRQYFNGFAEYERTAKDGETVYDFNVYANTGSYGNSAYWLSLSFNSEIDRNGDYKAKFAAGEARSDSSSKRPSKNEFSYSAGAELRGTYKLNGNSLSLTIDRLSATSGGETVDIITDSEIYVNITAGAQSISKPAGCKDILSLTNEGIKQLEEELPKIVSKIESLSPTLRGYTSRSRVQSANTTASEIQKSVNNWLTDMDSKGVGMKKGEKNVVVIYAKFAASCAGGALGDSRCEIIDNTLAAAYAKDTWNVKTSVCAAGQNLQDNFESNMGALLPDSSGSAVLVLCGGACSGVVWTPDSEAGDSSAFSAVEISEILSDIIYGTNSFLGWRGEQNGVGSDNHIYGTAPIFFNQN